MENPAEKIGKKTIRAAVLEVLAASEQPLTAAMMNRELNGQYRLAAVAVELFRLARTGVITRQNGLGPRGGYGYSLKEKP